MKIEFGLTNYLFGQHFTTEFVKEEVLTHNEKLVLQGAVDKRIAHFSTGRLCAKQALLNLNLPCSEILVGPDKLPVWPEGIVGSISHSDELVGAVVAPKSNLISIGLDIEKIGRIKGNMWNMLFTPQEQNFLSALSEEEKAFYTTLFFSMKESFYKLQYGITNTALWFTDVEIHKTKEQHRVVVIKEFEGKKLLPEYADLHIANYKDYIISVCFL